MAKSLFPKNFLWGASTAAHQVEGDTYNQWSEWERKNAQYLAETAKQRLGWLPNWSSIRQEATDPENYISGKGVEHYSRYEEDFTLIKQLNMNAFRFSIEWSRIEPTEGEWDEQAVEHYRRYIQVLRSMHIEPIMTLWHWTVPVWFAEKGAFEKKSNVHYFDRFVQKIAEEYGHDVRYILTLNEPNNYAGIGYLLGEWPPQRKNVLVFLKVYWNLVRAHKRAYAILKAANPNISVSIAMCLTNVRALKPNNPVNQCMARLRAYAINWWFLNRIKGELDYLGLNFYHTEYVHWYGRVHNPKKPVNDLGWYMEPESLERVSKQAWHRYGVPIIITENGLADANDTHRQWWIAQTIEALKQLRGEGVNIHGYLHWSLLDNFEWAYGWWPEFGLVTVDRKTMRRTIRSSALWFAAQIKKIDTEGK